MRIGRYILVVAAALWALESEAQSGAEVSGVAGKSEAVVKSAMVFDRTRIDGIRLSEDDAVADFVFTFTNRGTEPIVVTRVETSCGCAVADYARQPVQPGGRGEIKIAYNPKDHVGRLARKILVYTNLGVKASGVQASAMPTAELELSGEITPTADRWSRYPVAMGSLRAKRGVVVFNNIPRNGKREERLECVNSGSKALALSAGVAPKWLSLRTEPAVIEPGQVADIVVVIDGTKLPESCPEQTRIILEGMGGRPTDRTLLIVLPR